MMPGAGRESCKRNSGGIPTLQAVVENAPLVAGIQRLPAEVVNPSIQDLLAFKLNCLRKIFRAGGNVQVELIGERVDLRGYGRVLLIEVSVGKGNCGRDAELCGRAIFTGRGNAERIRESRCRAGCAIVAAVAAGKPWRFLKAINHRAARGCSRSRRR